MIVKLTQELARGFAPWKAMFYENEAELNALGAKLSLSSQVPKRTMTIR